MIYDEAHQRFNTDSTVSILVKTKDGLRVMSENNFGGGTCSCCYGCDSGDDLEVVRVIDVATMEVLWERTNERHCT